MSLLLDFNLCEESSCDELTFTELTGSGTTGWSGSNPDTSEATFATLSLIFPNGTTSSTIDLISLFPSSNDETEFIVTTALAGVTEFEDGVYTATYTVVVNNSGEVTYSKTCYFYFDCKASCCVDKLFAKVRPTDCHNCENSKLKFAIEAAGYLQAAKFSIKCGNVTMAKENLKKVQYMCNYENCKSC